MKTIFNQCFIRRAAQYIVGSNTVQGHVKIVVKFKFKIQKCKTHILHQVQLR